MRAIGEVVYKSPQWAAHAREKLHGFEYPPGFRLIVKPLVDGISPSGGRELPEERKNLLHIAETIAQASSLIQAAGLNPCKLFGVEMGNSVSRRIVMRIGGTGDFLCKAVYAFLKFASN